MAPTVSVIIPLFNARRCIGDALRSLAQQSMSDWEAMVVDDGSTDSGHEVVEAAARADARVRLVRQANAGQSAARNAGIEATNGRFVVFLDNDDWMMPDGLRVLVEQAEGSTSGAAHGAAAWYSEDGTDLRWAFEPTCPRIGLNELLAHGRFITASQIVAREALGPERFNPRFDGVEDHDLWLRLASRGVVWNATGETVCAYRLRAASDSRRYERIASVHRAVLQEGFARARLRPEQGIDTSLERESSVLVRTALHYATASALHDPSPEFDRSAAILTGGGSLGFSIDAEDAATAAFWALPYADCRAPGVWFAPSPHTVRLSRVAHMWWRRCVELGLAGDELPSLARRALARLATSPEAVAERLAERCSGAGRVVVLGLGRQAPAVVRALHRRGIRVSARDHSLPEGTSAHTVGGVSVTVEHAEAPFDPRAAYLMTVADDGPFLARLPKGLTLLRWSDERERLDDEAERRISPFWTEPTRREAAA